MKERRKTFSIKIHSSKNVIHKMIQLAAAFKIESEFTSRWLKSDEK